MTALDSECCDAVAMLSACMLVLRQMLCVADLPAASVHIAARLNDETAPVIESAWLLASAILHRTIDPAISSLRPLDAARQSLDGAMTTLAQAADGFVTAPRAGGLSRARRVAESAPKLTAVFSLGWYLRTGLQGGASCT
ncbi:hypothetical protein BH11GEM1_BH11GEM1_15680 [soil metagenome]